MIFAARQCRFASATTALLLACVSVPALADTAAGTRISNIATLHTGNGATESTIASNEASLTVGERLDVALTAGTPNVPSDPNGAISVPVLLTNGGNGSEAFDIAATSSAGLTVRSVAIDLDGDGRFDPAIDTLVPNGRTPAIAAGGTLKLLIVLDADAGVPAGASVAVSATAATGSGTYGHIFGGQGDGGGDAVVGATGAKATVTVPIDATSASAPALVKTQTVVAPDGSATPTRKAIVTYVLEARFSAAASAAEIDDPIPDGTAYVAGTLRLDGALLSDAADADAGSFDGARIAVSLGDLASAGTRTVQFKVKIK